MQSSDNNLGLDWTLIFFHINKAAGQTFRSILQDQYRDSYIYTIYGENTKGNHSADFIAFPEEKKRRIKVLMGHMPFGLHVYFSQPSVYITFLRNPLDRLISLYYYILRVENHPQHDLFISSGITLETFLTGNNSAQQDNYQVRILTNSLQIEPGTITDGIFAQACLNLHKYCPITGIVDRYDESLILFKRAFGWNMPCYKRKNVSSNRKRNIELSDEVKAIVEENNRYDFELYNRASKLLDSQIIAQGEGLAEEVAALRRMNENLHKAALQGSL